DRDVERLQRRVTPQAIGGAPPLLLAEHLDGELLEALELERRLAAVGEVELDPARDAVGALGGHAGRDQSPRHQPLRVRKAAGLAERERVSVAPFHHAAAAGARARSARSSSGATTSLAASTTRRPRASACSATTSIAAPLSSTRYVSASTPSRSAARA